MVCLERYRFHIFLNIKVTWKLRPTHWCPGPSTDQIDQNLWMWGLNTEVLESRDSIVQSGWRITGLHHLMCSLSWWVIKTGSQKRSQEWLWDADKETTEWNMRTKVDSNISGETQGLRWTFGSDLGEAKRRRMRKPPVSILIGCLISGGGVIRAIFDTRNPNQRLLFLLPGPTSLAFLPG